MRPTDLHFKSPKEELPDYRTPTITRYGKFLAYPNPKNRACKKFTFGQGKRFTQYRLLDARTSEFIGPGAYNPDISFKRLVPIFCSAKIVSLQHNLQVKPTYNRNASCTIVGSMVVQYPDKNSNNKISSQQSSINIISNRGTCCQRDKVISECV